MAKKSKKVASKKTTKKVTVDFRDANLRGADLRGAEMVAIGAEINAEDVTVKSVLNAISWLQSINHDELTGSLEKLGQPINVSMSRLESLAKRISKAICYDETKVAREAVKIEREALKTTRRRRIVKKKREQLASLQAQIDELEAE